MIAKVVLLMGLLYATGAPGQGGTEVRTLAKGTHSGVTRAEKRVVKTPEEWQQLWNEHTAGTQPRPALPAVDFGKEMVLAVFLGEQRMGGYSVEVTGVKREGTGLVALVKQTAPRPGGITIQALTQPFHFVAVGKTEGKVSFSGAPGK